MRIEIINEKADEIQNLTLDSNPFKIGEIIHLSVNNKNKKFWSVEEMQKTFIIDKIEHYVIINYLHNETVHESVSISIEVSEVF